MSRRREGERILGPYEENGVWRVVYVDAMGKRESSKFDSEAKAERYIELLRANLSHEEHTSATALEAYTTYLTDKDNKEESIAVTAWAIEQFFPSAITLQLLSAARCSKLYEELRTRPSERTRTPIAADTHRNIPAQTKSFLAWCASAISRRFRA